ncbi:hypothetical protein NAI80_10295, partial [Francisella tularensis subsp. holarctica]|nr:hypothetical protein [Francisella tularensis subsp. holarctica]
INLCEQNNCLLIDPATIKVNIKQTTLVFPISSAPAKQDFKITTQSNNELDFIRDNISVNFILDNNGLYVSFKNSIKLN